MIENSNPNNIEEKEKNNEEKNKLNYSFSPTNNSNSNTNSKNNKIQKNEKEKEKEIKIKKSITKGKILGGQFIIGEEVGKGTFGVVRIATHIITGEKVAVKMLYKEKILEESDKKRLEREIKILKILRHRNIVHLYNVIQTSSTIYLVMEYIKGKELFEIIVHKKRLTELEALRYFQQLISGIEYLGKIRVAHRDLKPENLLIDSRNTLKIADFGLSNMYKNNELLSTACGSPCYAAPEMIAGEKYYGLSADIWSSGIILYTMLCGRLPFEDKDNEVLYKKIKEGNFKIPDFLSENAKDFLVKILNVNPKKRYTIAQIKKHPWFNLLDQRKYMSKGLLLNKFIVPIDEDIVTKMENEYEYNSKEIRINLLGNKHNHITTTYYLILKKKIKKGINSICDMTSNDFLNYIHNPKNLLANYNGDWKKLFKERGIKTKIERTSTFKSNSSNGTKGKNENKNKNEINNDNMNINIKINDEIKTNNNKFDEDNILINNKSEDFLIEKNDNKNEDIKNDIKIIDNNINTDNKDYNGNRVNNEIKTNFAFENKNNEFKEKIDEIYKQKNNNINNNNNFNPNNDYIINNNINIYSNTENITNSNNNTNIENKHIINDKESKKEENNKKRDSNEKNKKILIPNYKEEKIISINLEDIDKNNYTPSTEKEIEQSTNTNIHVNTISFSGTSNTKNLVILNKTRSSNSKTKSSNSKNSENCQNSTGIQKFRIKNNNNSKSAEKGNKLKKKSIFININKINIDIKKEKNNNNNIKKEKYKTTPINIAISKIPKKLTYHKTVTENKLIDGAINNKNNSTKLLYYLKNQKKSISNNHFTKKNNSITINKSKTKYISPNKNEIKIEIKKNSNNNHYGNIINNKINPTFSIDKNKVTYNQNTNYSKKISIEGIYYAHKKNMQEINNLYNKISYQSKHKKKDNSLKKFLE